MDKKWQESLPGAHSQLFTEDLESAEGELVGFSSKKYSIDAEIEKAKGRPNFTSILDSIETRYRGLMAYIDKTEYDYAIERISKERHSATASGSQVTRKAAKNPTKGWEKGLEKKISEAQRKSDKVSSDDIHSKNDPTARSSVTLVPVDSGDSQTLRTCLMQGQNREQHKPTLPRGILPLPAHLQLHSGNQSKKDEKSKQRSRDEADKSHVAVTKSAESKRLQEYYALEEEFQNALGRPGFRTLLDTREQTYKDFKDHHGDAEYKAVIDLIAKYRSLIDSTGSKINSEVDGSVSKSKDIKKKYKKRVKERRPDDENKEDEGKKLVEQLRVQEKIARNQQANLKQASRKAAEDLAQGVVISRPEDLEIKNDQAVTSSTLLNLFASSELFPQHRPDTPFPSSEEVIDVRDLEKKLAALSITDDVEHHESQQGGKTKKVSKKKPRKKHKPVTKEATPVTAEESTFRHVPEENKVLPASEEDKNQSDDIKENIDNVEQKLEGISLSGDDKERILLESSDKWPLENNKPDKQSVTTGDISIKNNVFEGDTNLKDRKDFIEYKLYQIYKTFVNKAKKREKKINDVVESKGKWLALEGEGICPLMFPEQIGYPSSHLEGQISEIPEGRLDRLLMQDRDKTSFQLLWKILQQLETVIVIKEGGWKVLRILWSDKNLPLSGEHKQLVKDLELVSSLGNGIADLILALVYNANATRKADDIHEAELTFDTGINLMWYLKQAAIRGQVQALTLMWFHMGSESDWQDALAFLTLSSVGFSDGAAPFHLPVELAICPEKKLETLEIFSTLPDTWSADEDKRIADIFYTRASRGEAKFQTSVLKLLGEMAKRVREVKIGDANRKLYIRRFGLLASIIKQLPFSDKVSSYSDITPLVVSIDKYDITDSYRSLLGYIDSWKRFKKVHAVLKKQACESTNDEAQLVSLLIYEGLTDIQFKELWLSWIKTLHTSMGFTTSPPSLGYLITRDVPEMGQLVIRRTMNVGTLNGPYAIILAKRLRQFRGVLLDSGATPEFIKDWEKALLWRGVELGSADAAKFWYEWYGINDEPGMAKLAVQRYMNKLKTINQFADNNWSLILKVTSLYENLNQDDLKEGIRDVMETLDFSGLDLGKLRELKLKIGLNIIVPDVLSSLLNIIDADGALQGNDQIERVIEEALIYTKTLPSQMKGYLNAVQDYYPGHLERDEAESVLGTTFVAMAKCIPKILKDNIELVFDSYPLVNKLLQKALEFGNEDAGLEIANLNVSKLGFLSAPINVVEPDWLKNILIPLAMSAEKQPLALKHLAAVLLSYPQMYHFSAVLSLYQALHKSEKLKQLNNDSDELLVSDQGGLLNIRVNQLVDLVNKPLHDRVEDTHEFEQMITAQRLIETATSEECENNLNQADIIIARNLRKNPPFKHTWEYLRSEVLIQIAVHKTARNEQVNSGAAIEELEKYIKSGNQNFNLILLYLISSKKSLKAKDLLQMERYAYAAFSLKEEMPENLGLLPVQLICLSSTFIYKGGRLLLLASSYLTAAGKNSKYVKNAEEKALYLLKRAAQWGEGQAYRTLCDYWQHRDIQKYNEHVWRYMRFIYDQTHTSPNYDGWAVKNTMLLRDSTFSEAHAYFSDKIADQKK